MSAESKESVKTSLYAELHKCSQNGDYDRGLRSANKILQQFPQETLAFHCKIVCLLQLGKFQEALNSFSKNSKLSGELYFEKAYAYYRMNCTKEALDCIITTPKPYSLKVKELLAQIYYRMQRYDECFKLYQDLIKNSEDEYEDERLTNLAAVMACLPVNDKADLPTLSEETYELVYNSACRLLKEQRWGEAEIKLKTAEKMCRQALEDDELTEEEIENELAIIKVQLAFCIQQQGVEREKEAMSLNSGVLKQRPDDIALVAVASNNIITLNRDTNVFDSKKKIKSATVDGLQHKLTTSQRKNIAFNHCLLLLYTAQYEQCRQLIKELESGDDGDGVSTELSLLMAALYLKEKKPKQAIEHLQNASFDDDAVSSLARAQLLLSENRVSDACDVLEKLCSKTYQLGLIAVLVNLYKQEEKMEKAAELLKQAMTYYKQQNISKPELKSLWQHSADLYNNTNQHKLEAECLKELLQIDPDNTRARAQLICALALFSPSEAQKQSSFLPDNDSPSNKSDIDVESLESSNWLLGAKIKRVTKEAGSTPESAKKTGDSELIVKRKRKKKKKIRLPKQYDPSVPPDPERWLPRRERSHYRKRTRDRRHPGGGVGKGTQGASSQQQDLYDITKKTQSPKATSTPSETTPGPRQQRGAKNKQANKSKHKGKKH